MAVRQKQLPPLQRNAAALAPPAYLKLVFAVQPMQPFDVHLDSFPTQHCVDRPISKAALLRGEPLNPRPQLIATKRRTCQAVAVPPPHPTHRVAHATCKGWRH